MMAKLSEIEERVNAAGWLMTWLRAANQQADLITRRPIMSGDFQAAAWMFALALASVERAAEALVGAGHAGLRKFRAAVPNATHVRDMATHFDDYLHGVGKLQKSGKVQGFNAVIRFDGENHALLVAGLELAVEPALQAADQLVADVMAVVTPEVSAKYQKPPRPDLDLMRARESDSER